MPKIGDDSVRLVSNLSGFCTFDGRYCIFELILAPEKIQCLTHTTFFVFEVCYAYLIHRHYNLKKDRETIENDWGVRVFSSVGRRERDSLVLVTG